MSTQEQNTPQEFDANRLIARLDGLIKQVNESIKATEELEKRIVELEKFQEWFNEKNAGDDW